MQQIAIAVQRGNADIMIQAAQRARGKRWSRQRRHRPVARRIPHSRSRGREGNLDVVEGERRQRDSRALACVARLIGLPYSATACLEPSCNDADSEAETELAEDDAPSAVSSMVPAAPTGAAEQMMEAVSTAQRRNAGAAEEHHAATSVGAMVMHDAQVDVICAIDAMAAAVEAMTDDARGHVRVPLSSLMEGVDE